MAAISATKVGDRLPQGRYFEQTFDVVISSVSAADEWIETGFSEIVAVTGLAVRGTDPRNVNFVRNAQGTGESEGSTLGALGIETDALAGVHVTVLGKA